MPKVLRIINRFNLGGPTYNVAYLSRFLEPDFETLLVGGMKDETEDSSEFIVDKLNLKPTIIPEMKREIDPRMDWVAYNKIKDLIREFKPDILHSHASKAGTLGRLAAINMGVPVIAHTFHGHVFHSYFGAAKTRFYKGIERYLAARSTRIIAISERQKEELTQIHKIAPANKVSIIPLGFDLSRFRENTAEKRQAFRQQWQVKEDEIAIGIIGRLVPIKNHRLFLEGLRKVLDNSEQKIRAFIVGDGESRNEVMEIAKSLNIPFAQSAAESAKAPLTFTSWIREVDVVYAGLDIVALTSLNEGTPVSLIEAQAAGKPIVTTDVGGIGNIVRPGVTAKLSAVNDLEKFVANLLEVVQDGQLRDEMGAAGWDHVKERFHYLRLARDVGNLYHELLQQAKAGKPALV